MARDTAISIETGLTEKQEAYCRLAVVHSKAEAYRQVYKPGLGYNISKNIWELEKNPAVTQRILQLQVEAAQKLPVRPTLEFMIMWWMDRMLYDPKKITAWAIGACRHCYGCDHKYQWREPDYWEAVADAERNGNNLPDIGGGFGYNARVAPHPDCPKCDGKGIGREDFSDTSELGGREAAAFEGVKRTKDGIEIKMADKAVAAQQVMKLTGMDVQTLRILNDELPTTEELRAIIGDPLAAASRYKQIMTGGTRH